MQTGTCEFTYALGLMGGMQPPLAKRAAAAVPGAALAATCAAKAVVIVEWWRASPAEWHNSAVPTVDIAATPSATSGRGAARAHARGRSGGAKRRWLYRPARTSACQRSYVERNQKLRPFRLPSGRGNF